MPARPARAELDELLARIGRDVEGVAVRLQPLSAADVRVLAQWAVPAFHGLGESGVPLPPVLLFPGVYVSPGNRIRTRLMVPAEIGMLDVVPVA